MAVSRTVLREQVKDVLLERILRGELKPGDALVETRIASELGTSQAPVREALRDLELLRLVESEPFRSARVREVTEEGLLSVFPVRAVLEELAAREAARRLAGDAATIRVELDAMRKAASRGDRTEQLDRDLAFHRAVVEGAGNPALTAAWLALGVEVPTAFAVFWTYWEPMELVDFHLPILQAVEAGDSAAAGREARQHVKRTEQVVRRRARERARSGEPELAT
ncbi:MAG: GntR family transcriptional regulator [Gaiella sp.]